MRTPAWARYYDTVPIVTDSVYQILEGIAGSCRENDVFRRYGMYWIKVRIEERRQILAKSSVSPIRAR